MAFFFGHNIQRAAAGWNLYCRRAQSLNLVFEEAKAHLRIGQFLPPSEITKAHMQVAHEMIEKIGPHWIIDNHILRPSPK